MFPGNHLVVEAFLSVSLCGLSASVVDLLQYELNHRDTEGSQRHKD